MPMVYLNGEFVSAAEARVSVFDRGFLFGDAVYEVLRYFDGKPFAMDLHIQRLHRTLGEVRLAHFRAEEIIRLGDELLARNDLRDACVYWQITRGTGPGRSHLPPADLRPTVFGCADPTPPDAPTPVGAFAFRATPAGCGSCSLRFFRDTWG